jgi:hypothetical protein
MTGMRGASLQLGAVLAAMPPRPALPLTKPGPLPRLWDA